MTTTTEERPAAEVTAEDAAAAAGAATPSPAATLAAVGTGNAAMALRDNQTDWTPGQRAMLTAMGVGNDVLDAELQLFLYECQRRRLDPFAKQICLIGRNDRQAGRRVYRSQTTIDGFRLIARRAADDAGVDYGYEDTIWYDRQGREFTSWASPEPPAGAKVVVLRNGQRFPASARFGAYAATFPSGDLMAQWASMPDVMIAKCAEALALRKAFPEDLGGLYTEEEMMQAENQVAWTPNGGQAQRSNGNGQRGQRGSQQNRRGQNGTGNGNGQRGQQAQRPAGDPQSEENRAWLVQARGDIPTMDLAGLDRIREEGIERTKAGQLTVDDARELSELISACRADLKAQELKATQLDPEDSWYEAVEGITSPDDAPAVRAQISKQFKPNEVRYQQLMKAVNGRCQILLNAQAAQVQTGSNGMVQGTAEEVPPA